MTMDARKQRVLQAIVALYGLEGEPVGSSVLANYFDMAVSSATLRNEMANSTDRINHAAFPIYLFAHTLYFGPILYLQSSFFTVCPKAVKLF